MYENIYSNEKQTLQNGESKISESQFTKSLTSFHIKSTLSKNIINQNPGKKVGPIKNQKTVKNKRVYLSR